MSMMHDQSTPDHDGHAIELFRNGEFSLDVQPDNAGSFHVLAPGLARALGVADAYTLLRSIPDEEKGSALVRTPGGKQQVSYVTEAGFYRALGMRQTGRISDPKVRTAVERFQSWVYRDVLPAIRRGEVVVQPAPREVSRRELAQMVLDAEDRADAAEAKVAELEPRAAAADALSEASGTLSIGTVGKALGIGRTTFFRILYAEGILCRDRTPQSEYAAWFRVVVTERETGLGRTVADHVSYFYPEGALRLHHLLTHRGYQLRKPAVGGQLALVEGPVR